MGQVNWNSTWKLAITISLTAIMEIVVVVISEMSNPIFLIISLVASFLASLAIVQISWVSLTKFIQWIKTPKIRNIKLEKKYLEDGTLAIVLSNKERRKPAIFITKLQIADNPLTWFPSSMAGISIKSGSSKEIFYIKWDKPHRYFVTADFQNDDYEKVFGYGVYKFDIVVTYGFSKSQNDKIKRFSIIVSLEENSVIRVVEMKHAD